MVYLNCIAGQDQPGLLETLSQKLNQRGLSGALKSWKIARQPGHHYNEQFCGREMVDEEKLSGLCTWKEVELETQEW